MTKFHDFDPWDVLIDLQQTQLNHDKSINTIAAAHNVTQAQVNKLVQLNQHQRQQIRQLQVQIDRLQLNIESKDIK